MKAREFKDLIFQQFANIATAFSSPKRLEIIDILEQGEKDVETLSRQISATFANTSRHLQILKNARLVESRRDGVRMHYRLADEKVFNCWKSLQSLAENRVAEIREVLRDFLAERNAMNAMSKEELWSRIESNDVIVLDVRPEEEFSTGHIPGAISIPLSELRERLNEIPHDREIVAYCRGPYCVLSPEAIKILLDEGYDASRLEEGLPEWREAGLPVM
ncbi:MAG: metalloregulator ArsR/SmtB family transcription factor [Bacteroidetes bacterium]|nr:metalloregulator ArsR/SmtB family transcription factor [Bacteroidota bacterium]MCH7769560.1 metalloregulator ArsR/SmtB family transcription factor [Bacteroidota bacterium]